MCPGSWFSILDTWAPRGSTDALALTTVKKKLTPTTRDQKASNEGRRPEHQAFRFIPPQVRTVGPPALIYFSPHVFRHSHVVIG